MDPHCIEYCFPFHYLIFYVSFLIKCVSYVLQIIVILRFTNLICPMILKSIATFVLVWKDGHSHVCPPIFASENKILPNSSICEPNCFQTKAFMNGDTTAYIFLITWNYLTYESYILFIFCQIFKRMSFMYLGRESLDNKNSINYI